MITVHLSIKINWDHILIYILHVQFIYFSFQCRNQVRDCFNVDLHTFKAEQVIEDHSAMARLLWPNPHTFTYV